MATKFIEDGDYYIIKSHTGRTLKRPAHIILNHRCSRCGAGVGEQNFNISARVKSGLQAYCAPCSAIITGKWHAEQKNGSSPTVKSQPKRDPAPVNIRDIEALPANLKSIRETRGWSLHEVETQTGVSAATIGRIEKGGTFSFQIAFTLAEWLRDLTPIECDKCHGTGWLK